MITINFTEALEAFTAGLPTRATGTVKWFRGDLGYGFILPDDGGEEVFVHWQNIEALQPGYRTLGEGERVSYEPAQGERGPAAHRVRRER